MASPKRFTLLKCGLPPPPVDTATHSEPYFSSISMSFVAISVMASSQVMRSHWFWPRSPTRRMGYLLRLGWYSAWMPAMPFAHRPPWLMGLSGLPSILMTRPFFTCASTAQLAMQARQAVFTIFTSPPVSACAGSACTRSSLTATPRPHAAPSAAADFTKLRRVMVGCVMFPPPCISSCISSLPVVLGCSYLRWNARARGAGAIGQRFTRPWSASADRHPSSSTSRPK